MRVYDKAEWVCASSICYYNQTLAQFDTALVNDATLSDLAQGLGGDDFILKLLQWYVCVACKGSLLT